jgi:hypothetical protein
MGRSRSQGATGLSRARAASRRSGLCARLSKWTTRRSASTATTPPVSTKRRSSGFGLALSKPRRRLANDYPHLDYHVASGNFERVDHGIYRFPHLPPAEHDQLIRLSLWNRNRKGEAQAVVSHESALVLHDLTELLPGAVHLTVPPAFRKAPPRAACSTRQPCLRRTWRSGRGFG